MKEQLELLRMVVGQTLSSHVALCKTVGDYPFDTVRMLGKILISFAALFLPPPLSFLSLFSSLSPFPLPLPSPLPICRFSFSVSGETSVGDYPFDTVGMMGKILTEAESIVNQKKTSVWFDYWMKKIENDW